MDQSLWPWPYRSSDTQYSKLYMITVDCNHGAGQHVIRAEAWVMHAAICWHPEGHWVIGHCAEIESDGTALFHPT